jgi:twitching motility protein PilT
MTPIQPKAIFQKAAEMGASDVHIAVGVPVTFRIADTLTPVSKGVVSEADVRKVIKTILGEARMKEFEKLREVDVSYTVTDTLRLRVNCHFERGVPSLAARLIPQNIPSLEQAGLVGQVEPFLSLNDGLILFTGPAGVGKSTSMAAMINAIRTSRPANIITLEDPVEFLFPRDGGGIVRQRQAGTDFDSFGEAMRRVLRQDPDVVMVGEMRDLETIGATLTLAETGHLVFGTLHTPNAMQTIDRIVDVFPPHQQAQVRSQLSLSLRAIIAQRLIPAAEGGLIAIREILVNNAAVAHLIRENHTPEIKTVLQTGAKDNMTTFEADAKRLHKEKRITDETLDAVLTSLGRK